MWKTNCFIYEEEKIHYEKDQNILQPLNLSISQP